MNIYLVNIVLALIWAAVNGSFDLPNLIFGFVLGAVALYFIREQVGKPGYLGQPFRVIVLMLIFVKELTISVLRVALLVMSPNMNLKPGIFAYPLRVTSDFEITLLSNMITLTPGTLAVDVSDDRSTLFVHALDCSDPDAHRRSIAEGFEQKIMEAFGR